MDFNVILLHPGELDDNVVGMESGNGERSHDGGARVL